MSNLRYILGKCKWCEYFSHHQHDIDGMGMCGPNCVCKSSDDTCNIRSFRLKVDTSLHEEYYDWLYGVYKEIGTQLEAVGRHPGRNPELVAQLSRSRGQAKHTCRRGNYRLLKMLNLDQYGHPIRDKHQYISGLIICLNCGLVFTANARYVEYSLTSPSKEEYNSVYPRLSEESKALLVKYNYNGPYYER